MIVDSKKVYRKLKLGNVSYDEKKHCPLILEIMLTSGRYTKFCVQAFISDRTFFNWVQKYPFFRECYEIGKMFAHEAWEQEGEDIKHQVLPPGVNSNRFEHWRLIGWSRFGISRNSKIKLNLDPQADPSKHYSQLLEQAAGGDFTAAEIKQLMEAINVGLSTHHAIGLQKQIDELKADAAIMKVNSNGNNPFSDKGT